MLRAEKSVTMKIYIFLAFVLCAYAADVKETKKVAEPAINKDKRQTQDEFVPMHGQYRVARKQEQVAPVEEPNDDDKAYSRSDAEQYRPGQVFSLNTQELLELQQERKAPISSNQLLQQLYNNPQPEHMHNLQQIYYVDQQTGRQVTLQPSHAVIARPDYTSNGGEASVGAALSVSDNSANARNAYNQDLLALLGQSPARQEEPRQQLYPQPQHSQHAQPVQPVQQAPAIQSVAPQYQQVDRYITKPSKKTKLRNKPAPVAAALTSTAPQQYLIETTNVQQQQPQPQQPQQQHVLQQHVQQPQPQQQLLQQTSQQQYSQPQYTQQQQVQQPQTPQYHPTPQPQRLSQALRYVSVPQPAQLSQQVLYDRPETQGLKVVPAPKLQQPQSRPLPNYRIVYQNQPEAQPKQYRIIEAPRPQVRPQEQRITSQSIERPLTYLKRFPEHEKMRSVKIYEPVISEGLPSQSAQVIGEQQYYLRPMYRGIEHRPRYEMPQHMKPEQRMESPKPPQSSIFVSKNFVPRKQQRPQPQLREQSIRTEQPVQPHLQQVNLEQHGQNLDDQRARLPPPRNNKAYTPEEFAALVDAGYSVTPVPVSAVNLHEAQSRSSLEPIAMHPKRFIRPLASRRNQYLPLRGDEAP